MTFHPLLALHPLDGRYAEKTAELHALFSEYGLIKQRLLIEIRWFQTMANEATIPDLPALSAEDNAFLESIIQNFDLQAAESIKAIEATTQHDVKAVEYYLQNLLAKRPSLTKYASFLHFACTSEDINNLAYALNIKAGLTEHLIPLQQKILQELKQLAEKTKNNTMLARTHGQAASPTTFGKEMAVFSARCQRQIELLNHSPIFGKFNGAVGNYNAHVASYPNVDWLRVSKEFVLSFALHFNPLTTQIESHDYIAEICHTLVRFNTILIDLARDIWGYISLGYLKQAPVKNEVGSSTMPHKINPILFENAEANLGLANNLLLHLASQLPISRWQRDLTDSTRMRNLGVGFGYSFLAYKNLLQGLSRITLEQVKLQQDLTNNYSVLAEAIQTVLRRYHQSDAYEQLKELTRGKEIDRNLLHKFIQQTKLPTDVKQHLLSLTPENYIGLAKKLAELV